MMPRAIDDKPAPALPDPRPARPMTGAELRTLREELRLRARVEGFGAYQTAALEELLRCCLEDERWPPFAQWILQNVTMHLAPSVPR